MFENKSNNVESDLCTQFFRILSRGWRRGKGGAAPREAPRRGRGGAPRLKESCMQEGAPRQRGAPLKGGRNVTQYAWHICYTYYIGNLALTLNTPLTLLLE